MEIGEKLRTARQLIGMTQEQVGEAIHVRRQTISNWETGKSLPDVLSVIGLSDLYKVSLDELLKGDVQMLQHIEESTNAVKSRQRLSMCVEVLSYLVIWAVCVAVFWLGAGTAGAMGYSLVYLWGVLPLATFVVSVFMGLDVGWTGKVGPVPRKCILALCFGVFTLLAPALTFQMANTVSTGTFHGPEWMAFFLGVVLSALGMTIGSFVRRRRKQ